MHDKYTKMVDYVNLKTTITVDILRDEYNRMIINGFTAL